MRELVVFTEEPSAKIVTAELCRKLGCGGRLTVIDHQGKKDLLKSLGRKIGAWRREPLPRFVVLCDNDNVQDCKAAKIELAKAIPGRYGLEIRIRLVMQELEAWYLADFLALQNANLIAGSTFAQQARKQKYRNPELLAHPKEDFRRLTGISGAIDAARRIAPHLDLDNARSASFRHFVAALRWAAA